ncbi:MAG: hypothetical protein IKC56_05235, partial [Clostridia bacterium]|nr:hypothetical protein [Clostridia bacterium]
NKPVQGQIPMNLFDFGNDPVTGEDLSKRVLGSNTVPQTPITVKQIHPQEEPTTVPSNVAQEQADDKPATPMAEAVQLKMNTGARIASPPLAPRKATIFCDLALK